jgi:hypothetical protein
MVIKMEGIQIGWVREVPGGGVGEVRLKEGLHRYCVASTRLFTA